MKRAIKYIGAICVIGGIVAGCVHQTFTPMPKSVGAVAIGIGYGSDKDELIKKGAYLDMKTFMEGVAYCYSRPGLSPLKMTFLLNHNATVEKAKVAIGNALTKEVAIIYFSCKATKVPTTNPNEPDGYDEALMLYDGLLMDDEIWDMLKKSKSRVFLVFDTCYASSMMRSIDSFDSIGSFDTFNSIDLVDYMSSESLLDRLDDEKYLPGYLNVPSEGFDVNTNALSIVCWAACNEDETIDYRSIGSRMTNSIYFNKALWRTYDEVFERIQKALDGKQNVQKIVIGEDFGWRTIFR